jgi:hypothetical protein
MFPGILVARVPTATTADATICNSSRVATSHTTDTIHHSLGLPHAGYRKYVECECEPRFYRHRYCILRLRKI